MEAGSLRLRNKGDVLSYLDRWARENNGTSGCSDAIRNLLYAAQDLALSSQASRAIGRILDKRCTVLLANGEKWTAEWIEVIADWLSPSPDLANRERVFFTYILPALSKIRPRSSLALLARFSNKSDYTRMRFALLKAAKSFYLVRIGDHNAPAQDIARGLVNLESSIRLDCAALLIDSPRTTIPFEKVELDLLETFYSSNMNVHSAEFNQKLALLMSSMVLRLRDSLYAVARDMKSLEEAGKITETMKAKAYLKDGQECIQNLIDTSRRSIFPASSYSRTLTAISFLLTIAGSGVDPTCRLSGKDAAPRPGNSSVVFPFQIEIFSEQLLASLLAALTNPFATIREASARLVSLSRQLPDQPDSLLDRGIHLCLKTREAEADAGARLVALIWEIEQRPPDIKFLKQENGRSDGLDKSQVPLFLQQLVHFLIQQISTAKKDLAIASQHYPMHGAMVALRRIVEGHKFDNLSSDQSASFLSSSLDCIDQAWEATRPFLAYQAPEGHVISSEEDWTDETAHEAGASRSTASQLISSCCWRTMKAAADFLSAVCFKAQKKGSPLLIDDILANRMGSMYREWIVSCRHRGAFSAIGESYGEFCKAIAGGLKDGMNLLREWLDDHLNVALSDDISLIGTRRSAGLPLMILAVLNGAKKGHATKVVRSGQIEGGGAILLRHAMSRLFDHAVKPISEISNDKIIASVHSRNIIKAIIADGRLAKDAKEYYTDAFLLSIEGFTSTFWDIRNASMMLYSTLIHRTLGEERNKRFESDYTRAQSVNGFFESYPGLFDFVLQKMQSAVENEKNKLAEHPQCNPLESKSMGSGLFPLLLMLGRLRADMSNSPFVTDRLLTIVQLCLGYEDWKVREACSDALLALIKPDELIARTMEFLDDISDCQPNLAHGRLLVMRAVSRRVAGDVFRPVLVAVNKVALMYLEKIREEARWSEMLVVMEVIGNFMLEDSNVIASCKKLLEQSYDTVAKEPVKPMCLAACASYVATCRRDQIDTLLHHDLYEVRAAVLDRLRDDIGSDTLMTDAVASTIRQLALHDPIERCQRAALVMCDRWLNNQSTPGDWLDFSRLLHHSCGTIREQSLLCLCSILNRSPRLSELTRVRFDFIGQVLLQYSDPFNNAYTREATFEAITRLDLLFRPEVIKLLGPELCPIYGILLNLVLDDDRELREKANTYVAEALAREGETDAGALIPEHTSQKIFDYLLKEHLSPATPTNVKKCTVEHLCAEVLDTNGVLGLKGYTSAGELLKCALASAEDEVLFAIERPNAFRESLLTPEQSAKALTTWLRNEGASMEADTIITDVIQPWRAQCATIRRTLEQHNRQRSPDDDHPSTLSLEAYELDRRLSFEAEISALCT